MLDFDAIGGLLATPYVDGITFTPNCYYDFIEVGFGGSAHITVDPSACGGGELYNAEFPGG